MKDIHIKLWHSPFNGGWIGFDRKQWKRFSFGWNGKEYDHLGNLEEDRTLWWCIFGFWGRILIKTWPWQKHPGPKYRKGGDFFDR